MDPINLKDFLDLFFALVKKYRKTLFIYLVSSILIGLAYSLSLKNIYKSESVLMRSEASRYDSSNESAVSDLLNLDTSGDRTELLARNIAKSRDFYFYFVQKRDVLPELVAVKKYYPKDQSISYDSSLFNKDKREWRSEDPSKDIKELLKYHDLFLKHFQFIVDRKTKVVSVNTFHLSPYIAQQWSTWFIEDLNTYISINEIENAQNLYDFLTSQLPNTPSAEIRRQIGNIMLMNLRKISLSKRSSEYAYEVIDKPSLPIRKDSPRRSIIMIIFFLLGLIAAGVRIYIAEKF